MKFAKICHFLEEKGKISQKNLCLALINHIPMESTVELALKNTYQRKNEFD